MDGTTSLLCLYNQAQSVLERSLQTSLTVMKNPQVLLNAGTCECLDITFVIDKLVIVCG